MTNKLTLTRKLRELYTRGENLTAYLRSLDGATSNTVEDVMLSYDFQAGSYVAAYYKNPGYLEGYTRAMAEVLRKLGTFRTVLEVGVGEATTMSLLAEQLPPEIEWLGFDISWSRVKVGQRFVQKRGVPRGPCRLFCADLFHIPLADHCVDLVYTSHALGPNGGRESEAIQELLRVATRWIVLLEPAYDLASLAARERMEQHGYVRNLAAAIRAQGAELVEHRLFDVSANPLNPTGLYVIRADASPSRETPIFVCPITRTPLELEEHAAYAPESMLAYPILDGVPCLSPANAIVATKYRSR